MKTFLKPELCTVLPPSKPYGIGGENDLRGGSLGKSGFAGLTSPGAPPPSPLPEAAPMSQLHSHHRTCGLTPAAGPCRQWSTGGAGVSGEGGVRMCPEVHLPPRLGLPAGPPLTMEPS
ncbi:unnamed protein product [Pipistrellus nathusii]|uniref:Uncharacterized protein n=1 Tax=Pipistrellus nathusii TaxID=59473 RepID=A0ABN9ZQQ1_PIPNA